MHKRTYIMYNVSTLGRHSNKDWKEVIEIGAYKISFDTASTKILGEFHTLVHPVGHQYDSRTTRYLHIHENELLSAPYYSEAIEEFIRWSGRDAVYTSWDTDLVKVLNENNYMSGIYDFPRLRFMSLQEEFKRYENAPYAVTLPEALSRVRIPFCGSRFSPMATSYNMIGIMQTINGQQIGFSQSCERQDEAVIDGDFVETTVKENVSQYVRRERCEKVNQNEDPLEWLRQDKRRRQQYSYNY